MLNDLREFIEFMTSKLLTIVNNFLSQPNPSACAKKKKNAFYLISSTYLYFEK